MILRQAQVHEAPKMWHIRNQAIRHGCKDFYDADVLAAWTPDLMPPRYADMIADYPFFVIDNADGSYPVATGFLDLSGNSVEAIFVLPEFHGQGLATRILAAIKQEAQQRGISRLTLTATLNAYPLYLKHGFNIDEKTSHYSALAGADLACYKMSCPL